MTDIAEAPAAEDTGTRFRAFLIADIRGYSTYTRERGHEEAVKLAAVFVDLAGEHAGVAFDLPRLVCEYDHRRGPAGRPRA